MVSEGSAVGFALAEDSLGDYLRARGVLDAAPERVVALGGGVSNIVLAVDAGDRRLVVKQSLPRLNVAEEWLAKRERALTEAAALRWAATHTPTAVPHVVDVDPDACALVVERAPAHWRTWKDDLLDGTVDREVAARLGGVLRAWHEAAPPGALDDQEAFVQLRIDPYHRTVARRHPALAARIDEIATGLLARRAAFVHGDFSPKNVLVGPEGLWVIDFEVGHLGEPVFDVAFLVSHLVLKAVRRPASAAAYREAAEAFLAAYGGAPGDLVPQVACLLLARVDGKSPVEYLDEERQARVRATATRLLTAASTAPADLWEGVA